MRGASSDGSTPFLQSPHVAVKPTYGRLIHGSLRSAMLRLRTYFNDR
jgi:hypothetical protein